MNRAPHALLVAVAVMTAAPALVAQAEPSAGGSLAIENLKPAGPSERPPVETLVEVPKICADCTADPACRFQWAQRTPEASRKEEKTVLHTVSRKTFVRAVFDVVRCAPKTINAPTDEHILVVEELKPVQVIQDVPAFFQVVPFSSKQPILKYQLK